MYPTEETRNEIAATAMAEFAKYDLRIEAAVVVGISCQIAIVRNGPDAFENWGLVQQISDSVRRQYRLPQSK